MVAGVPNAVEVSGRLKIS